MSAEEMLGTAGVARRPRRRRRVRSGPAARGGTPTPTTTSPSTATTSATSTSSGAPRACARTTRTCWATSAGRRVLEVGCGSAPCARWLRHAGRAGRSALDLSGGDAAARRRARRRDRRRRPARAGRRRAPAVRRRRVRPGLLGVRRGAVRGRLRAGDARGGAGAAARRAVGVRGEPPDALDVLRRPRARTGSPSASPTSTARPTSRSTPRAPPPTSSTTARSATGSATSSPPGSCSTTSSSRSGRTGRETVWGQWSPLRGRPLPRHRDLRLPPSLIGLRCRRVDRPGPPPGHPPPRPPVTGRSPSPSTCAPSSSTSGWASSCCRGRATRSSAACRWRATGSPTACCTAARAPCSPRPWGRCSRRCTCCRAHPRRAGAQLHPPPGRGRRLGDGPGTAGARRAQHLHQRDRAHRRAGPPHLHGPVDLPAPRRPRRVSGGHPAGSRAERTGSSQGRPTRNTASGCAPTRSARRAAVVGQSRSWLSGCTASP